MRKLTVIVPDELLQKATRATKSGVTPTVRMGLRLLAARDAYARLRRLRGKVKLGMTWQEIRGEQ
ncbi:MAG TPA: hypothetical protein VG860_12445 [Terriglobia bacterium]|nr:hypothetical protein [Terriglobia bacterium]